MSKLIPNAIWMTSLQIRLKINLNPEEKLQGDLIYKKENNIYFILPRKIPKLNC